MTFDKMMVSVIIHMFTKKLQDIDILSIASGGKVMEFDAIPDALDHLYNKTKADINSSLNSLDKKSHPLNDFMTSIVKECEPQ